MLVQIFESCQFLGWRFGILGEVLVDICWVLGDMFWSFVTFISPTLSHLWFRRNLGGLLIGIFFLWSNKIIDYSSFFLSFFDCYDLRVRDPCSSLSHYISTLVIFLPNRDLNYWVLYISTSVFCAKKLKKCKKSN